MVVVLMVVLRGGVLMVVSLMAALHRRAELVPGLPDYRQAPACDLNEGISLVEDDALHRSTGVAGKMCVPMS
jgi:hypothetical protein